MSVEMKQSSTAEGYSVVGVNCGVIKNTAVVNPRSQWAVWSAQWQEGRDKPSKRPYNGGAHSIGTNDVDSWVSFDEAHKLYETGAYDGVGVLMSSLVGFVGIDLDDCLDEVGHALPKSKELVKAFHQLGGYIEFSPSGKGLRQFIKGKFVLTHGLHLNCCCVISVCLGQCTLTSSPATSFVTVPSQTFLAISQHLAILGALMMTCCTPFADGWLVNGDCH